MIRHLRIGTLSLILTAKHQIARPLKDRCEVIVVGGGWVGMLTAARLNQAGITDIRIIESGSDFGGTWYWNRYPGAQCDIESYSYLPLLEETGYVPKLRFSYASEIYEHAQRIGRHFDLYKSAVFQTWVTEIRWLEDECLWLLRTNRGDEMRARYVCLESAGHPACLPASQVSKIQRSFLPHLSLIMTIQEAVQRRTSVV